MLLKEVYAHWDYIYYTKNTTKNSNFVQIAITPVFCHMILQNSF